MGAKVWTVRSVPVGAKVWTVRSVPVGAKVWTVRSVPAGVKRESAIGYLIGVSALNILCGFNL